MPTEKLEDKIYRIYDSAVGLTMLRLCSAAKDEGVIRLVSFNPKNKEHLFLLRVAMLARDIYGIPIEVDGSRWSIFWLNQKIKKRFEKIKRYSQPSDFYHFNVIWVPTFLDTIRNDIKEQFGDSLNFADIYNAYYEGSCD